MHYLSALAFFQKALRVSVCACIYTETERQKREKNNATAIRKGKIKQ